jgi:hypothetical protein
MPASMDCRSATALSSPSPRTIESFQGASLKTWEYIKVGWKPPSTDGDEVREHLFGACSLLCAWSICGVMAVSRTTSGWLTRMISRSFSSERSLGHGIDEPDVRHAYALECTADIGDPTWQPVSRDFRTTAVTVRLDHQYMHENSS